MSADGPAGMPADGPAGAPSLASTAVVEARQDLEADPALEGLVHAVDFTRFDSRAGQLGTLALAAAVAVIAARLGTDAAILAGAGIAVALLVAVLATERDRWRAQDVLAWYQGERLDRWIRDTGDVGPRGDPAAAEIWLGAHQPGTVPQLYRALAAGYTQDAVVIEREIARMPEASTLDRAWKAWFVLTGRLQDTGIGDPAELARLVDALPPSSDRSLFLSVLALVASARRRMAGDRRWIEPLADERSRARRTPLGFRRRTRIWLSRFVVVIMFAVPAVLFSSFGLAIAERGDPIPPEYAKTEFASRGDLPAFDSRSVTRELPALARALPDAVRVDAAALDDDAFAVLIDESVPTFIWTTGAIDVAGPSDAPGRHLWEVEILLGGSGDTASSAIVTFDGERGPRYLYRIDPDIVTRLRQAVGLPVGGTQS